MPKAKLPNGLRPYAFHGVEYSWNEGDKDATCTCPFCDKEEKFGIKIKDGRYNCFPCGEKGNWINFRARIWKESQSKATPDDYERFAEQRKIQSGTLKAWGVIKSFISNEWLIPGFASAKNLEQLYQYVSTNDGMRLLPTPTLGHQLFGVNLLKRKREMLFLTEGPWDGMALWETLGKTKEVDGGYQQTSNPKASLLQNANVLAVPGCNVFFKEWLPLFRDKIVVIMFDNDHPRENPKTKKMIEPAGLLGTKRIASMLRHSKNSPREIKYLNWEELKNGD